jgi:hypothetical protein
MKRVGLVLVVAACGSSSSKTPDASIDAAHSDAPADSATDAPPMATGTHHHYVINKITWPTTSTEARMMGFDLDGDGSVNNQLGQDMATLSGQGFDVQTAQDAEVARGLVLMLADVQATDLTTATDVGFTTYAGENPNPPACNGSADTVCGHHLDGTASFDVAAMPRETPIVGAIAAGQYTGGPGKLPVELSVVTSAPVSTTLIGAHAKLTATANGITQGIIGGAIPSTDIDMKIYPAMAVSFNAVVARDCTDLANPPGCGCAQNSNGATLIQYFDTNQNCDITDTELKNNALIMNLFAPDVTIDGQMGLSVGFAFTAVGATFTP